MGFNAEQFIEPLDYNFEKFGGPSGTIPEPSDKQIYAFNEAMRSGLEARGVDITTGDRVAWAAQLAKLDVNAQREYLDSMVHVFADLCGGSPDLQQLQALPYRIRNAFFGWLAAQLSPEA